MYSAILLAAISVLGQTVDLSVAKTLDTSKPATSSVFAPDGKSVFWSSNSAVYRYSLAEQKVKRLGAEGLSIAIAPTNDMLVTSKGNVWDHERDKPIRSL